MAKADASNCYFEISSRSDSIGIDLDEPPGQLEDSGADIEARRHYAGLLGACREAGVEVVSDLARQQLWDLAATRTPRQLEPVLALLSNSSADSLLRRLPNALSDRLSSTRIANPETWIEIIRLTRAGYTRPYSASELTIFCSRVKAEVNDYLSEEIHRLNFCPAGPRAPVLLEYIGSPQYNRLTQGKLLFFNWIEEATFKLMQNGSFASYQDMLQTRSLYLAHRHNVQQHTQLGINQLSPLAFLTADWRKSDANSEYPVYCYETFTLLNGVAAIDNFCQQSATKRRALLTKELDKREQIIQAVLYSLNERVSAYLDRREKPELTFDSSSIRLETASLRTKLAN